MVSRLGLHLTLKPSHLLLGELKLRCLATISQAYSITNEEVIIGSGVRPSGYYAAPNGPNINVKQHSRYQVGDTMEANCTSAFSNQIAKLLWQINDVEADPVYLIQYPARHESNLFSTALGLKFNVRANQFQKGEMTLKCTSMLFKVIYERSEETVLGGKQQSSGLHVSESSSSVHGSVMKATQSLNCVIGLIFFLHKWM
ncbi:uncharacterized protein LOC143253283 [Tachypleus tridentatus]|uniref:uncharacterized protein LOC143253283 n=1 Tax=Tachypleus tridentatus TaxID=6853 RepID=UPI003FCF6BF5